MTVEGFPRSGALPQPQAAPLLEACYAWVTPTKGREGGFLTLNAGFLHCHPWPGYAIRYPDQAEAVRAFTLWSNQRLRYGVLGSLRLVGASEFIRAGRVAAIAESVSSLLLGVQVAIEWQWSSSYRDRQGWLIGPSVFGAGGSGSCNNPDLVQPIGLWTRSAERV